MAKLKVYGTNADGTNRVIIAATSRKSAAEMSKISQTCFRDYGGETANAEEVAQAMSEPGIAFYRRHHDYGGPWRRWSERHMKETPGTQPG